MKTNGISSRHYYPLIEHTQLTYLGLSQVGSTRQ